MMELVAKDSQDNIIIGYETITTGALLHPVTYGTTGLPVTDKLTVNKEDLLEHIEKNSKMEMQTKTR